MRKHRYHLLAIVGVLFLAAQAAAQAPGRPGPPPVINEYHHGPMHDAGPGACTDCCPDCHQDACCCNRGCLAAGFAFVFLQPHFEDDTAFLTTIDNGTSVREADTAFNYDLELAPRVWLEYCCPNQVGIRASWWQFDHAAPERSAVVGDTDPTTISAPVQFIPAGSANFDPLQIVARQPGDVFRSVADLDIDVVDLEGTKWTDFCSWQFGASAGLRYASIKQSYRAGVFTAGETLLNGIDASHRFDGVGPTFAVEARRPWLGCLSFFSMARGSLLFGDGRAGFTAAEQITPTAIGRTITVRENRNDVLPMAELQVGVEWVQQSCSGHRFFCRTALEGQVWQGVGNATQEEGDLGLFGFHVALGMSL